MTWAQIRAAIAARNAIRILKEPKLLKQFRKNALAQAKRFDIDAILPHYEEYYEQAEKELKIERPEIF